MLGLPQTEDISWFASNVRGRLRNGRTFGFGRYGWLGNDDLYRVFPNLFNFVYMNDLKVVEMDSWSENSRTWDIHISEDRLASVGRLKLHELCNILQGVVLKQSEEDVFVWWRDPNKYSVKSSYLLVFEIMNA